MVEEILPNLYRIEIPLPNNPLKVLNSYVVKAPGRSLIIDTGLNRQECESVMRSSLEALSVDLRKTDFFITHMHADHCGLVGNLATDSSKVYFNELEASLGTESIEENWDEIKAKFSSHGFQEDELEKAMTSHPGFLYTLKTRVDFCIKKEGDVIDIGDYSFRCLETPGHTPAHTCLYEPEKNILISGDHILFDITPHITPWTKLGGNSLKMYLGSLDKVYNLNVNLVLPGHRSIRHSQKKRIDELRAHHKTRLNEVLSALKEGEKTAFQIAPYITWDIKYRSWEFFPSLQKFFAVAETVAHLQYLEEESAICRNTQDGKILFSLT